MENQSKQDERENNQYNTKRKKKTKDLLEAGPPKAIVGPRDKTLARARLLHIITYFYKAAGPLWTPGPRDFAPSCPSFSSGLIRRLQQLL